MILIFDFDGHLYSGENIFRHVRQWVNEHRRNFLPHLNDEEFKKIVDENVDFYNATSGLEIARELYKIKNKYPQLHIDIQDFWQCQQNEVYNIDLEGAHIVDTEFLKAISSLLNCYVVSNSSPKHIEHYMKKIGLDPAWFNNVVSNRFEEFDQTKQHYYIEIRNLENVSNKDIWVFGDSYESDLLPAIKLGMNACLTKDSHNVRGNIINAIKTQLVEDKNLEKTLVGRYLANKNCQTISKDQETLNLQYEILKELHIEDEQIDKA